MGKRELVLLPRLAFVGTTLTCELPEPKITVQIAEMAD
jgi:hypothetical protein